MQNLVTVLHRAKAMYCLCCRCSGEYVGEYCQYKNPCNNGEQKCQNGGTCTVLYSPTQAPTFKVCLFYVSISYKYGPAPLWKFDSVAYPDSLIPDPSFFVSPDPGSLLGSRPKFFMNKTEMVFWLKKSYLVIKNSVHFFFCLHEGLSIWRSLECSWAVLRISITLMRIRILPSALMWIRILLVTLILIRILPFTLMRIRNLASK